MKETTEDKFGFIITKEQLQDYMIDSRDLINLGFKPSKEGSFSFSGTHGEIYHLIVKLLINLRHTETIE